MGLVVWFQTKPNTFILGCLDLLWKSLMNNGQNVIHETLLMCTVFFGRL